ncbi:MAG: hypothetical protein WKF34_00960 [Pyrinomonadaceae bacterium]
MKKLFLFVVLCACSLATFAQPRPVDKAPEPVSTRPAYEARYEGGLFGQSDTEKGSLKFDDINERVVFYRKDGREMFAVPYSALIVIYPDSKVGTSTTGNVVSRLPLPGAGLAGLLSKRTKFLIMQFDDPEVEVKGTANFKFEDKEMLLAFINALGQKAKMKQRGDAYYRARSTAVF